MAARKKQAARARKPLPEFSPTFSEPDARWVRAQWSSLPEDSSAKLNLTAAGLDKYLQTPLLRLDLGMLKAAVALFDGNGIRFDNHYVKIDPQTVSNVTGLPSSGDPIDMFAQRRRSYLGNTATIALEICGTEKAYTSKGIKIDLIKPVELKWAAAVLVGRVFGQQRGEYLALWHFDLVKRVSQGHRFNWAEFLALRIKEQLAKIQKDGKGCFYMGTVLSGLIYDQVPPLRPPEQCAAVGGNPSLMKWAAPRKECGGIPAVKQENAGQSVNTAECPNDKEAKSSPHGNRILPVSTGPAFRSPPPLKVSFMEDVRPLPLGTIRVECKGGDSVQREPEKTSFRQLLQRQFPTRMLLSTTGGLCTPLEHGDAALSRGMGSDGDRALSMDRASENLENSGPCDHPDEMSASAQTCSVSGSPCDIESPRPKRSEVAGQLDSPSSARKHTLFQGGGGLSSKRAKPGEHRPPEVLLGVPLHQMATEENVSLFRLVFDEVEKRLFSANRDCECWKSCAQVLYKDLNDHFAGLPMKEFEPHDNLNESSMDSLVFQHSRAYIKKAARIIEEQDRQIQLLKAKEEHAKALEFANVALKSDLEMEMQRRQVAEARTVYLENQLQHIKQKLQKVLED